MDHAFHEQIAQACGAWADVEREAARAFVEDAADMRAATIRRRDRADPRRAWSPVARRRNVRRDLAKNADSILQTVAIASGISGPRRSMRPALAIRQIATQHGEARCGKHFRQTHQQRCPRVGSGAMRENQTIFRRSRGQMNESANIRINRCVDERLGYGQHNRKQILVCPLPAERNKNVRC
jgi:hypothetical protein